MSVTPETIQHARGRVGQMVKDKWRLEALLGAGGTACVYSAVHRNGRRVAIKVLHPELSAVSSLVTRFLREGYLANKVGHPGAVAVLDDDRTDDGAVFLVMELLEGHSLERYAKSGDSASLTAPSSASRTRPSTSWRRRMRRASSTATSSPPTCS